MTWGITKDSWKTIKNTIPPEQAVKSNFIDIIEIKGTFMFAFVWKKKNACVGPFISLSGVIKAYSIDIKM